LSGCNLHFLFSARDFFRIALATHDFNNLIPQPND